MKISPSSGSDGIRVTNVFDAALCKANAWHHESEARFFILQNHLLDNIKEFYVELEDVFFEELEVTCSPLMTDDQIVEIKNEIVNLAGGNVRFRDSELKNCIRLSD